MVYGTQITIVTGANLNQLTSLGGLTLYKEATNIIYIFKNPWVPRSGRWRNLSLRVRKVCIYDALGLFNDIM